MLVSTLDMSEQGHNSPVDLSKMRLRLNRLEALKTKLDGIKETEEELHIISDYILKLKNILKGARNQCVAYSTYYVVFPMMLQTVTFSMVAAEDLKKAGVTRRLLIFEPAKVTELTS